MNILIFGATGFIGNALFHALVGTHTVTIAGRKPIEGYDKWKQVDFLKSTNWDVILEGMDLVINAVGIIEGNFAKTQIERVKSKSWDLHETVEKSNGRVTTRRVAVTNDLSWMQKSIRKRWYGLSSLIAIESESYDIQKKKTTKQTRFYISSLETSAEEFQKLIRQHWSIENGCHWVLDTLYREDHSQVRAKNAAKNFAILRRIALNLLKIDNSIKKSLPMKQMRAMASEAYRENILHLSLAR